MGLFVNLCMIPPVVFRELTNSDLELGFFVIQKKNGSTLSRPSLYAKGSVMQRGIEVTAE